MTVSNANSNPRILFATTVAATLRAFLLPLARHFREQGWRVDAIANGIVSDDLCRSSFDRVWEATWTRNPLHIRNLMMVTQIQNITIENQYDIVHVHTPVAGFVTRLGLRCLKLDRRPQVFYTAHGFHFHSLGGIVRNYIFETIERSAAKWTNVLIVMNKDDFQAATAKNLIVASQLKFMPGIGVDRSRYSRSAVSQGELSKLLSELELGAATPILIMVAEFTGRKHHSDAIRAFSMVRRTDAHFVLAGNGPLLETMKLLVNTLGLSQRIHFLGNRDDIPCLMRASRAVILPSVQEGLPRCILEAMSMGVPAIGTRIRGTTDLLEQKAGLLVDVGNIRQLTAAMQLVLDDEEAARVMGNAGLEQSKQYDLLHILHMHQELYEEALGQRSTTQMGYRQHGLATM